MREMAAASSTGTSSFAPFVGVSTVAVGGAAPFVALQRGNAWSRTPHVYLKEYATAQFRAGSFVLLETGPSGGAEGAPRDRLTGVYEVNNVKGRVVFLAPTSYDGLLTQFEGAIDGVQGTLTPVSVTLTHMEPVPPPARDTPGDTFRPRSRLTGSSRPLAEAVYTDGAFRQVVSPPAGAPPAPAPPSNAPPSASVVRVENHGVVMLAIAPPAVRPGHGEEPRPASPVVRPVAPSDAPVVPGPREEGGRGDGEAPPCGGRAPPLPEGEEGEGGATPPPSPPPGSTATTTTSTWRRRVQAGGDIVIRVCGGCGEDTSPRRGWGACGRADPPRRCRHSPAYVGGILAVGASAAALITAIIVVLTTS